MWAGRGFGTRTPVSHPCSRKKNSLLPFGPSIGEGTANPGGIEYRYIIKSLIPIGFAIMFLQSLSEAIKSYLAMRRA